jgi:hypothetical protein
MKVPNGTGGARATKPLLKDDTDKGRHGECAITTLFEGRRWTPHHERMARGGHGRPKTSLEPTMSYPSTPLGWPARRTGSLQPCSTPLDTPRRTPMFPMKAQTKTRPKTRTKLVSSWRKAPTKPNSMRKKPSVISTIRRTTSKPTLLIDSDLKFRIALQVATLSPIGSDRQAGWKWSPARHRG